jgi:MFS family permease
MPPKRPVASPARSSALTPQPSDMTIEPVHRGAGSSGSDDYSSDDDDKHETTPLAESASSIYAPESPELRLCLADTLPFHYGYVILVVCGVGLGMSGPGQTTTFGVLVGSGDEGSPESLLGATGTTRSSSAALWMVATFASAATMLRGGFLLDRLGPQWALSATALALGLGLLGLSLCSSAPTLFFGLYLLRLFGQGCMMLIPPYTVALWWVERRGFAYAITLSIGSIGINYAYPMMAKTVMESPGYTWRDALRLEALVCLVGTLPLGMLFYRGRPELYGLLPDGRGWRGGRRRGRGGQPPGEGGGSESESEDLRSTPSADPSPQAKQGAKAAESDASAWEAGRALRTTGLWATCGGVCLIACIAMGVWFHLVTVVTDATPGRVLSRSGSARAITAVHHARFEG